MNEYNEKVIKDALNLRRAEEDAEFLKEIQQANNNPDFKMKKNEAKQFVKEVSKTKNHRPMLRAASVILVVAASLVVVTMSVEGFGEKITSFFANFVNSDYAAVDVDEKDELFSTYQGQFVPTAIPEGYEVEMIDNGTDKNVIILRNRKGKNIVLKEQSVDLKANVDTEEADIVKEIEINGMTGLYAKKDDTEKVALNTGEFLIYVTDNDPKVDLIGFAELIEKR